MRRIRRMPLLPRSPGKPKANPHDHWLSRRARLRANPKDFLGVTDRGNMINGVSPFVRRRSLVFTRASEAQAKGAKHHISIGLSSPKKEREGQRLLSQPT